MHEVLVWQEIMILCFGSEEVYTSDFCFVLVDRRNSLVICYDFFVQGFQTFRARTTIVCYITAKSNGNVEKSILMYSGIGKKYYFCMLYCRNADCMQGMDR